MIKELFAKHEANAVLAVALAGTIAALVANGPGRLSLGRILSGVLSNPIPRRGSSGARAEGLSPSASERRGAESSPARG